MRKIISPKAGPFVNVISINEEETGEIIEVHENVNDIFIRKENQYLDWECWAGVETLNITANGDVYNASCKQKKLGNIFSGFVMPTEPTICTKAWCACAASLNITKTKTPNARQYLKKVTDEQS